MTWAVGLACGIFMMVQGALTPFRQFHCSQVNLQAAPSDLFLPLLATIAIAAFSLIAIVFYSCKANAAVQESARQCLIVGERFPTVLTEIKSCAVFLVVANTLSWSGYFFVLLFRLCGVESSMYVDVVAGSLVSPHPPPPQPLMPS